MGRANTCVCVRVQGRSAQACPDQVSVWIILAGLGTSPLSFGRQRVIHGRRRSSKEKGKKQAQPFLDCSLLLTNTETPRREGNEAEKYFGQYHARSKGKSEQTRMKVKNASYQASGPSPRHPGGR